MVREDAEMGGCRASRVRAGPWGWARGLPLEAVQADQVPSSPGRLWSKGSRAAVLRREGRRGRADRPRKASDPSTGLGIRPEGSTSFVSSRP